MTAPAVATTFESTTSTDVVLLHVRPRFRTAASRSAPRPGRAVQAGCVLREHFAGR